MAKVERFLEEKLLFLGMTQVNQLSFLAFSVVALPIQINETCYNAAILVLCVDPGC